MDEKLAKILTEELAAKGLSEEEINEILAKTDKKLAEEGDGKDANPEDTPNPEVVVKEEDAPTPKGEGDVPPDGALPVPPEEEGAPAPADDVPPTVDPAATDGSIAAALDKLAAQEEGGDVPPVPTPEGAPAPAPAPVVDPTVVEQLSADLGEAVKTIDALKARIESLEEALKESGVISKDSTLGDETPRITPNSKADGEDAFDDILATINGK